MQDREACVAVDDTILTVDPVILLSDSPDSRRLAHDVSSHGCCC